MKKSILLLIGITGLSFSVLLSAQSAENQGSGSDTLSVCYSPDLQRVAEACIASYSSEQDQRVIMKTSIVGDDLMNWLNGGGDVAFVTKESLRGVDPGSVQLSVIGREVYIPVMHPDNPCMEMVRSMGISPAEFASLFENDRQVTWGEITGSDCMKMVRACRIDDVSFLTYLSSFTGTSVEELGGEVKPDCREVLGTVREDPHALGFCTLAQLSEMQENEKLGGVVMVPVDINENNTLDHVEELYASPDILERGVWMGKYPGSLYSRIYAVRLKKDMQAGVDNFLKWMISEGQSVIAANGFSGLMELEQESQLASLTGMQESVEEPEEGSSNLVLLILGGVTILGVFIYFVFRMAGRPVRAGQAGVHSMETAGSEGIDNAPGGYYLDRSHTWTFMEKDGRIRVGVDNFLQHVTGRISRVGMKSRGDKIKKGEPVFSLVQQGKNLELLAPLSGKIVDVNEKLEKDGSPVNKDPYDRGWIYLIEPDNWAGESALMVRAEKYTEWIGGEIRRLRDFAARGLTGMKSKTVEPVLQDGGIPRQGLMEDLDPRGWEEFQAGFLHRQSI